MFAPPHQAVTVEQSQVLETLQQVFAPHFLAYDGMVLYVLLLWKYKSNLFLLIEPSSTTCHQLCLYF